MTGRHLSARRCLRDLVLGIYAHIIPFENMTTCWLRVNRTCPNSKFKLTDPAFLGPCTTSLPVPDRALQW